MPKQTFYNIDSNKRLMFTNAFLIAFTKNSYDNTSISEVLKTTGFAKGSFYQYFDNKLDLFNHLIQHCSESKLKYIENIKQEAYSDFWEYWRETYIAGIAFDNNEPIKSNFLYQMMKNIQTPSLQEMFNQYQTSALHFFENLVDLEVEKGHFRDDLPSSFLAHFMLETSTALFKFYQIKNSHIFENHIKKGLPIFYTEQCKTTFLNILDQNIELMKSALNKNK